MNIQIKNRQTAVFGMKREGKSNFVQWLLGEHPALSAHLMYDQTREHDALTRYVPAHKRGEEAFEELSEVTRRMVVENDPEKRPEVYAIEELSRFCSPNSPPPEPVYDIIDQAAHYGVGLITVARRPAQVHTDVLELATNIIIFYLGGQNDHKKLNGHLDGLGDAVRDLEPYQFVVVKGREYEVHSPVPEMDTTGDL